MIIVKNPAEIEKMKLAGNIAAGALHMAGSLVCPGANTADIDKAIRKYILDRNAIPSFKDYNGFAGNACISVNDTVIHGIPSKEQILQDGDIVSIDVGAFYEGFHGDTAYTFGCGQISEAAKHLMDVTQQSLQNGIEMAKVGNRIGDISDAVQTWVDANGFSVVRDFVGHGVGKSLHEEPEVPNFGRAGRGVRLVPGMALAIEPMVNQKGAAVHILSDGWTVKTKDGGLSAHFEHSVAITSNGPVILTKV